MNSAETLADFLAYVGAAPTPYHAVLEAETRLTAAGFTKLDEREPWDLSEGSAHWVVFGGTCLIAFVVPKTPRGFHIVGAHTDSPNLRLKPNAEYEKEGYRQLGVEVYGGALLNSWLDRDLSVGGALLTTGPQGEIVRSLVKLDRPIARVAQLAIHLDRDANDKGVVLNRQEHLPPLVGLAGPGKTGLFDALAKASGLDKEAIVGHDLMLYDTLAPAQGGLDGEFVYAARLDNLASCHAAIGALIDAKSAVGSHVAVAALFDHEEVGSGSAYGAESSFLPRILERIAGDRSRYFQLLAGSACVSADMAHAVHPNYAERHERNHQPRLNAGPVIKTNSQQRYATSAETAAHFRALCKEVDVPVQTYSHRTDLACGSTIGPITSTLLAIPTVDVGNPMLGMHSAREACGSEDQALMIRVLSRFFAT